MKQRSSRQSFSSEQRAASSEQRVASAGSECGDPELALPDGSHEISPSSSPDGPQTVTMEHITDLPMVGGDVTSVDVTPDGRILAVIDGMRTGQTEGMKIMVGPNGQPYLRISSTVAFHASADNGVTWTQHPAVLANYGGALLVRSNGDVLYYVPGGGGLWRSSNHGASFTQLSTFNTAPYHHNILEGGDGNLYSLGDDGRQGLLLQSPIFLWLATVRSRRPLCWVCRTDNFVSQRRSTTNGAVFTEVTQPAPGFVFTTDNRAINYNGTNGFTISIIGFTSTQPLTLNGFTGASWMVTQGVVDKQNTLYLLSSDQGLFKSTSEL